MKNTINQTYEKLRITGTPELIVHHQSAQGSPKGSIIFVHGICHGAWCFEKFMEYFSEHGYECFALNLRGHGDNTRKGLTFATLSQYMSDVARCINFCSAYMRDKGITEKPFLLGHSMGGAVVQKYMKNHFDEVKGTILFAPATAKRMPWIHTILGIKKENLRIAVIKALGFKVSDEQIARSAFFDNRIKSHEDIRRYNSRLHRESYVILFISLYLPYYSGKYNGNIPILVIGSYADSYFPEESLKRTAEVYGCTQNGTRNQLVILPDLCHDMMLDTDQWEDSANAVLKFMENNK